MEREGDRLRKFSRRALILAGAQGLLTTAVFGRMYYLGVMEAGKYRTMAEENRVSIRLIAPSRGEILDRHGYPIATNRKDYRVFLIPEQANDIPETLEKLGRVLTLSEGDQQKILRQIRRQRSFLPVTVAENLTWEDFARLNVESPKMAGVQPDDGESRYYPEGSVTAHVVGYVGSPSEEDLEAEDGRRLLELPGMRVGKLGLERTYESILRGSAGSRQVEVNAYGRVIRELSRDESQSGQDIRLTLDLPLQRYVVERLAEDSASAVILDIQTGEILAAASTPSYDSNLFNFGISQENWQALQLDPRKPLLNKVVQGLYPPGSTFKMVVAMAGLEAGILSLERRIFCSGEHQFGDRTFHCWKSEGHGRLDLIDATAQSCDIYYYQIAEEIGIDRISAMAMRFGLGQRFNIGLTSEQAGLVPTREWKLARTGTRWQQGETLNVGIGQGALQATSLQLAVMTARLASGLDVTPRLIDSIGGIRETQLPFVDLGLQAENLEIIHRGMEKVHEEGGTAYLSRLRMNGIAMAGKTGTAQVRRITREEREAGLDNLDDRPWAERDHALFVGYAPLERPRYALSVIVEHGGGGSAVAAPIARDLMRRTLERASSETRIAKAGG